MSRLLVDDLIRVVLRPRRFYLRFDETRAHIWEPATGRQLEETPVVALRNNDRTRIVEAVGAPARTCTASAVTMVNPFDHPRLVVGDYEVAVALLRHLVNSLRNRRLMVRHDMVIHPLRELAGGLSDIERQALVDMCADAGAARVGVHVGASLSTSEVAAFACGVIPP